MLNLRCCAHVVCGLLLVGLLLLAVVMQPRQRVAAQANTPSAESARPGITQSDLPNHIFGYRDFAQQMQLDQKFIASPDPKLAEEHLRALTSEPHMAGTPEDRKTAEYVAQKFRAAGLETQIVEYKVLLPRPLEVSIDVTAPANVHMHGPGRERVDGDPYQDDPRVVMPFNGYSPSGDVEADVVYANYGRPEDFKRLEEMKVNVRGKIVVVRYGANYRGVKSYVAQERGAAAVIIYSDPMDDGYFRGDKYPRGPFRPDTGVQRGSVSYTFKYPGDPSTPGVASTLDLPSTGLAERANRSIRVRAAILEALGAEPQQEGRTSTLSSAGSFPVDPPGALNGISPVGRGSPGRSAKTEATSSTITASVISADLPGR